MQGLIGRPEKGTSGSIAGQKYRSDLILVAAVTGVVCLAGFGFGLFDALRSHLRISGQWDLNGPLLLISVALSWYFWRRWKELEQSSGAMNASLEFLRKVSKTVEETGEAVLITDINGVIEYANPAFCRNTGYSLDEVIGKDPSILKSDTQDPAHYKALWEKIGRGEVWSGILIEKRKDGSEYPAMIRISPVHNDAGEITHFVSLQQDMTEQRKLEEQLLQAQKMEALGTLVGGIAHDFNNMLAALQGNVCLAKMKMDNPDALSEKLDNIELLSVQAAEMVDHLLTFARKGRVEMHAIELDAFIKEGIKLGRSAIPENISFITDVTDQSVMVNGDTTQLQQVLMNLLNNARDAVAGVEKPAIRITLERYQPSHRFQNAHPEVSGGQLVKLSVSDNGCGIPAEYIDKVYDPFFTTKGAGKGTGLGLAMVYGVVQSHGGILEIVSREGEGTAIHIYLPLLHEPREELSRVVHQAVAGEGETVLLVDDEQTVSVVVGEVLRTLGYQVVDIANGQEALDYFMTHRDEIDMVISDMVMPELGGPELVRRIRQLNSKIPAILISGYDASGSIEEVEQFDNCKLMSKPVAIVELSRMMRSMLGARASLC
ncbi:PAS domain S-box-containing protein [Mariprofundus ferrinatatus]|uniref:histidine kinase n=1 Tax=Mariprofundus ferrinatatus TaxID=1921087 RepID=A0A2K8L2M4_9PROT|nr:ATP-binding protein [Mariprofundus ferrinatatus]ATX81352.1 PAS domain S-box-containing protein [Mariprofundus ferrinatatus]